jgi:hypothetical protein
MGKGGGAVRGRSLLSANPDNVAAGGATDALCGGGRGERRVGVGQITAHSNPYSSFSSSFFPLCVRRGFDEKFSGAQGKLIPEKTRSQKSLVRLLLMINRENPGKIKSL